MQLFDLLGGADGKLNQQRIADELINHRSATGHFSIDVRPVALAILSAQPCLGVDPATNTVTSATTPLAVDLQVLRFAQRYAHKRTH